MNQTHLRNIAIIAHVDHGKTTLVDAMLKQTRTFAEHQKENQATTIMDSNDLERERGVTILAKNTAVFWHDYKINILDTPGHADFSGEVERVLNMADGCILLVDSAEGVLSQTRFVLRLALELGLAPIVLVNKVDRKDQRTQEVEREIADLFLELATEESQLEFPLLYGRGFEGIVGKTTTELPDYSLEITDSQDLTPLFETIITAVPSPAGNPEQPLQLQVTSLDWDDHKGKIAIGRIAHGEIRNGQPVVLLKPDGSTTKANVTYLSNYVGLKEQTVASASTGEIVAVAGMPDPHIGDTIADPLNPVALPPLTISEPTVKMQMMVNTSPFAGRDAQFSTSRQLRDRLARELETNVGLRLLPGSTGESVVIVGRGELHLAILIETMRREGYEFALSRPQVVIKESEYGLLEPWEYVTIDVPEHHTGRITSSMAQRRAVLKNMHTTKTGVRFEYEIATANLIGYRSELLTATSGEGMLHSTFLEFRLVADRAQWNRGGALIAHETGSVTAYSLEKAQQRGTLFVDPGDSVYTGQIVGINNRAEDIVMNVVKGKKLTNMRASSADATVVLAPAWKPSLEQYLVLIGEEEVLEVTPQALRLRSLKQVRA
jgi:GTP-binding protein